MRRNSKIYPADFSDVKTYPLSERMNKVGIADFALPTLEGCSVQCLIDSLPKILIGNDFRHLVSDIEKAYAKSKPVIVMMGGHVIKCGLAPVFISMMENGVITGIAMNGAASIHDFEIALIGETSEYVEANIATGKFGMWEETGRLMNTAVAVDRELGMGAALGKSLTELEAPHRDMSILASAFRLNIPLTVHVAIGTDIIHQHPSANGAVLGEASFTDFRILVSEIAELGHGGVLINFGSAVLMPEVFLKALSLARNLRHDVTEFTTANFDMIQHYRPGENITKRANGTDGKGYAITGHHEIMIPLLASAVRESIWNSLKH